MFNYLSFTMTILGVPTGAGFAIGTSLSIAAPTPGAGGNSMDMSLDEMIKTRRSTRVRTTSTADKTVAKGRAKRTAGANARRGLVATDKPSAKAIEKEVVRQAKRKPKAKPAEPQKGRKARSEADIKMKNKQTQKEKASKKKSAEPYMPPAWIGGTRRPPSKKAITAAVDAMTDSGFKVPRGMQMVISFAPAPNQNPTPKTQPNPKGKNNSNNSNSNNNKGRKGANTPKNNNKTNGNNTGGRGGGRGRGRGGRN